MNTYQQCGTGDCVSIVDANLYSHLCALQGRAWPNPIPSLWVHYSFRDRRPKQEGDIYTRTQNTIQACMELTPVQDHSDITAQNTKWYTCATWSAYIKHDRMFHRYTLRNSIPTPPMNSNSIFNTENCIAPSIFKITIPTVSTYLRGVRRVDTPSC